MKIAEGVEALDLPMQFAGNASTIYPLVVWDDGGTVTLVDTGVPGLLDAFKQKLSTIGLDLKKVRRIILTHQDIDHIGSAAALKEATGAEVMAHADDRPYIEGEKPLVKMNPERMRKMLESAPAKDRERMETMFSNPPRVKVDRLLRDGEVLPIHGGITIIHTPGHTPGHISLFLQGARLLVSGDALRVEEGVLVGPAPGATPDMKQAVASLKKLIALPVDRVLCYHGGLSGPNQVARIKELSEAAV